VKFDIPDSEPILVVDGILTNDSLMAVKLSLTQAMNRNQSNLLVDDATIEVFDKDSNIISVLNYLGNGNYVSNLIKPLPNDFYIFKISRLSKVYWVNDVMPDTLVSKIIDTTRLLFQGVNQFFQFKFTIYDKSLLKNHYGIKIKGIFENYRNQDTSISSEWLTIQTNDFILTQDAKSSFSNSNILFSDQYFNGQNKELIFGCANLFSSPNKKIKQLLVYSSSYSISAYNYFTSVNEHVYYQNDPFSLPAPIQGNVLGAYGGLVSQYMKVDTVRFK
jgi:hypothetical protein